MRFLISGILLVNMSIQPRRKEMKVAEGDALICMSEDCKVELVVLAACDSKTCGVECDIEVSCHGKPMKLIKK